MSLNLHKPSTKLAGLYLAIMIAISLFFSANVYQLSVQELDRGLRGPGQTIMRGQIPTDLPDSIQRSIDNLRSDREVQYQQARQRVLIRLLLINIVILIGGGFLSYYLARRTLKPIEEAHEAQSRFTADASHELRTPIAVMQTEIEVALMNPKLTLAQAKDKLASNLEELAKITMLSEGLLRLAQLKNSELPTEKLAVTDISQQAINRVLQSAEQKHILITNTINTEATVLGDNTSLVEALVIILDNAVKYSPEKTEITVSATTSQKTASIYIADHGIGIQATALPYIFDRFYRADSARSKTITGYGLGLAIAKNIIDAHHGKISVQSALGKGTTFTVQLPKT